MPPGLPHAFAAVQASDADLLIVITPGVERFEYFRHLARIATGQQPPESLLEVQACYDTFFDDSPAWRQARGTGRPGSSDQPHLTNHASSKGFRRTRSQPSPLSPASWPPGSSTAPMSSAPWCSGRRLPGSTTPPWSRPWAACTNTATGGCPPQGSSASSPLPLRQRPRRSADRQPARPAGIALIATLIWLGLYLRVAAPVNHALTAAAIAHVTPGNARALQSRWDSIITIRALLMAAAVAGLSASAATS